MGSVSSGVVAACFALAAFAIAILAGLAARNPASTILLRALAALLVCWPIGYAAGALCRRVIEQDDDAPAPAGDVDEPAPSSSGPASSSDEPAPASAEPVTR